MKENVLIQTVTVKIPFTQRVPDFGNSPLFLLPSKQSLAVICSEFITEFKLGLEMGHEKDGDSFTSHKYPLCSALYNRHFNQVNMIVYSFWLIAMTLSVSGSQVVINNSVLSNKKRYSVSYMSHGISEFS